MAAPTVLILDDDLGFCMWLGRALNIAGIRTLPACRSEEALEICADSGYEINLLIVNPDIDGCQAVIERHNGAKVMAIDGPGNLAVDAILRRPQGRALPASDRYVRAVNAVLNGATTC